MLRLLAGDLGPAVSDLTASLGLVRRGATLTLGLRAYFYLARWPSTWPGQWDDVLLTAEQGLSAAAIASAPVRAAAAAPGRGLRASRRAAGPRRPNGTHAQAERGRGQPGLRPGAGVRGDGPGAGLPGGRRLPGHGRRARPLAGRLGAGRPQPGVARCCGDRCWLEGLIGSGQLRRRPSGAGPAAGGQRRGGLPGSPPLAWLDGWLAEQRGDPERGPGQIYQRGEEDASTRQPGVHRGRLLLAHGRLLRRTGQRGRTRSSGCGRPASCTRRCAPAPFIARAEEELAACRLPGGTPAAKQSVLTLTSRETEVAHPGRPGPVQSGDRRRAVHQPQGGRVPPGQHLRQVRPARPPGAAALRRAMRAEAAAAGRTSPGTVPGEKTREFA